MFFGFSMRFGGTWNAVFRLGIMEAGFEICNSFGIGFFVVWGSMDWEIVRMRGWVEMLAFEGWVLLRC